MITARAYYSDVAFTPSVKGVQTRKGSRHGYARMEERGAWQTRITPDLARIIEAQTSVFLATVNADGQPYIQHRGGPAGFLRVLDDKTIGFADFAGNRQCFGLGRADATSSMVLMRTYGASDSIVRSTFRSASRLLMSPLRSASATNALQPWKARSCDCERMRRRHIVRVANRTAEVRSGSMLSKNDFAHPSAQD